MSRPTGGAEQVRALNALKAPDRNTPTSAGISAMADPASDRGWRAAQWRSCSTIFASDRRARSSDGSFTTALENV
jgi:hypothetical protein